MKRLLLFLLIALMLLSGCSTAEQPVAITATTMATEPEVTEPEVTEPEQDPNKITVGIVKSAYVTDYYENVYTDYLEQQTGLDIEIESFALSSGFYENMLDTMVEHDYPLPDIIFDMDLSREAYERHGKTGVFVDLAPYFNDRERSGDWWDRFEQLPEDTRVSVLDAMTCDGGIYGFPTVQVGPAETMDYQVYINRQWLDTLNLDAPTDPDSLYNVLKAFKERDPNGNGEADEIPLLGATERGGDALSWIINMFLYYDDEAITHVDENGVAYEPATTDTYRDALRFIRKLYAEELLSPLSLDCNNIDLQSFIEHDKTGIVCGNILECFRWGSERLDDYEAVPLWDYGVRNPEHYHISTYVTRNCKNVDAAWKLLMAMSTEESALIQRYGEKNISWQRTEDGILLHQDTWTDVRHQDSWCVVEATILPDIPVQPAVGNGEAYDRYRLLYDMWASYKTEDPVRTFDLWGESKLVELRHKYLLDFTTGKWDIEDDARWQRYVEALKALQ